MQIKDNVFVVTGGGNGMGRQIVLALLRAGAHVAAVDVQAEKLTETAMFLPRYAAHLSTHVADVTDRDAIQALRDEVLTVHSRVDGLINIAGIIHRFVPVRELSATESERIMNVNFWGTVNMCLAFLPLLEERPAAIIANMSSLSALIPFAGQTLYGASKGAVKQFSEGLHQELADSRVTVTTIFPGNISTDISGNSGVAMIDAGGRKVRSTTPEAAAAKIISGIEKNRFRVLVGADAAILDRLVRLSPRRATDLIGRQMKSVLAPKKVSAT